MVRFASGLGRRRDVLAGGNLGARGFQRGDEVHQPRRKLAALSSGGGTVSALAQNRVRTETIRPEEGK